MSELEDLVLYLRGLLARNQTTANQATCWLLTEFFKSQNIGNVTEILYKKPALVQLSSRYRSLSADIIFNAVFQCNLAASLAESVQVLPPRMGAHLVRSLRCWTLACSRKDELLLMFRELNISMAFCDGACVHFWPFSGSSRLLPSSWFHGNHNTMNSRWSTTMSKAHEYPAALRSFCEDVLSIGVNDDNLLTQWFLSLLWACLASLLSVVEYDDVTYEELKTVYMPLLQSGDSYLRSYAACVLSGEEFSQSPELLLSQVTKCRTLISSSPIQRVEGGVLFASLRETLDIQERHFSRVVQELQISPDSCAEAVLARSISRISEKAAGYTAEWEAILCQRDSWGDGIWLDFIEASSCQFLGRNLCLQLVNILAWAKAQRKGECHSRVTGVLLKVYEQLSAVEQWSVRWTILMQHAVDSRTGWVDVLSPIGDSQLTVKNHPAVSVASSLTGVLNKLHYSEGGAPQLLVACALMMPVLLLRELINRVFAEAGLTDVVVALLQTLGLGDQIPCNGTGGLTLFAFALNDCLKQQDHHSADRLSKVVVQFVEAACKAFTLNESVLFNGQNVTVSVPLHLLQPGELLQEIVLPALNACEATNNRAAQLPSLLMLQLLHFTVGQWQDLWPANISVVAVLSTLRSIWPFACGEEQCSIKLRSFVRDALSAISGLLLKQLHADSSPSWMNDVQCWLKKEVPVVDWQCTLLWQPLCAAVSCLPLRVPAGLLRVCDLPALEWEPIMIPEYGGSQVWIALLQFARSRSDLSQIAVSSLREKVKGNVERLSRFLASTAAHVMPTCCRQEWSTIINEFVQPLLEQGLITVSSPLSDDLQLLTVSKNERLHVLVGVVRFTLLLVQLIRDLEMSEEHSNDAGQLLNKEEDMASTCWMNVVDLLSSSMRDVVQELCQLMGEGLNEDMCSAVVEVYGSLCVLLTVVPPSFFDGLLLVASALLDREELRQVAGVDARLAAASHALLANHPALAELLLHIPAKDC